jgi:hypothetical protein
MENLSFSFEAPGSSWHRLRRVLNRYDIALFLGAGLSIPNKFPSWHALTSKLSGHSIENVQLLEARGISLSAQLQLAKQAHSSDEQWINRLRDALYNGMLQQIDEVRSHVPRLSVGDFRNRDQAARERVLQFFEKKNPALLEIVRACSTKKEGEVVANNQIGAILTTNLDAILQLCDRAVHGSPRMLRTVERATQNSVFEKISVYHLHGYLQMQRSKPDEEASDQLVLTEDEYLERNDDPYSWASVVLHWAVREFPMVFVGCSMTDELVRRALRRSVRERIKHFQAVHPGQHLKEHRWRRQFAVVARDSDNMINQAINARYAYLGVWPLWVDNYESDFLQRMSTLTRVQV